MPSDVPLQRALFVSACNLLARRNDSILKELIRLGQSLYFLTNLVNDFRVRDHFLFTLFYGEHDKDSTSLLRFKPLMALLHPLLPFMRFGRLLVGGGLDLNTYVRFTYRIECSLLQ